MTTYVLPRQAFRVEYDVPMDTGQALGATDCIND